MSRVVVRSRLGNMLLATLGAIYAISAVVVLAQFVADVWQAAATIDLAIQISLAAAAICGIWFIVIGLKNLGVSGTGKGLPRFVRRYPGARAVQPLR